jgi:hypothetical protein
MPAIYKDPKEDFKFMNKDAQQPLFDNNSRDVFHDAGEGQDQGNPLMAGINQ